MIKVVRNIAPYINRLIWWCMDSGAKHRTLHEWRHGGWFLLFAMVGVVLELGRVDMELCEWDIERRWYCDEYG